MGPTDDEGTGANGTPTPIPKPVGDFVDGANVGVEAGSGGVGLETVGAGSEDGGSPSEDGQH